MVLSSCLKPKSSRRNSSIQSRQATLPGADQSATRFCPASVYAAAAGRSVNDDAFAGVHRSLNALSSRHRQPMEELVLLPAPVETTKKNHHRALRPSQPGPLNAAGRLLRIVARCWGSWAAPSSLWSVGRRLNPTAVELRAYPPAKARFRNTRQTAPQFRTRPRAGSSFHRRDHAHDDDSSPVATDKTRDEANRDAARSAQRRRRLTADAPPPPQQARTTTTATTHRSPSASPVERKRRRAERHRRCGEIWRAHWP